MLRGGDGQAMGDDARSRFWDQASHDLRQPVQSLQLLAQIFARQAESDPARTAAGHMRRVVDDLARMHEALVGLSRLECGRTAPAGRPLMVGEVAATVARELGEAAREQGLTLRLGNGLGTRVEADPDWLALLLRGLLRLALVQAEEGAVSLTGRARADAVLVTAAFTGPALPPRQAEAVFIEPPGSAHGAAGGEILVGPGYLGRLCDLLGYRLELGSARRGVQRFRLVIPRTRPT